MATLARTSGHRPSLCSQTPPAGHQYTGLKAATAIAAGCPCRIGSDGLVYKSGAVTSVGVNANVLGFTIQDIAAGNVATLFYDERINYGDDVTPGKTYYASGTVAGELVDVAPFATAKPCAYGLEDGKLQLVQALY
jgi:hypothetical protein